MLSKTEEQKRHQNKYQQYYGRENYRSSEAAELKTKYSQEQSRDITEGGMRDMIPGVFRAIGN